MRLLVLALLVLASPVTAQPLVTLVESVGVQLRRSSTNVSVWPTLETCKAEARRLALADPRTTGTITYSCLQTITATYAPAPPVTPTVVLSVPATTVTCSPSIGPTLLLTAVLTGPAPTRVEFLRDGLVMQAVTAPPYTMNWQLFCGWTQGGLPPGMPTVLSARRVDGTVSTMSTPVTMLVLNPDVPPPPPPPPPPPVAFTVVAQWDVPAPADAVLDYLLGLDGGGTITIPATVNPACACIEATLLNVLAGMHTVDVRARNAGGLSPAATVVFTRP